MKRVTKTHPPREMTEWKNANKNINHTYHDLLGTSAHRALKSKLLQEQGWLCAYTGRAIDHESAHVEHIKPQSKCDDWEDVDYRNLVACFPADGGDVSHGYGAPIKASWWNESQFVSPLSDDCELRFRFAWSGHIHPQPDNHEAAIATIEALQLDATSLRQLRRSRVVGFFGLGSRSQVPPLSVPDARIALNNIERRDKDGRLQEFCFVIKQLLTKFIDASESGT